MYPTWWTKLATLGFELFRRYVDILSLVHKPTRNVFLYCHAASQSGALDLGSRLICWSIQWRIEFFSLFVILVDGESKKMYNQPVFLCFINYSKACNCVDHVHKTLLKTLRGMGFQEHPIALLHNLYDNQEAIVRTETGDTASNLLSSCNAGLPYHTTILQLWSSY